MIKHAILKISNFKQVERADIPPADGYALVVDGHIKHCYDDEFAARAAGVELLKKFLFCKSRYTSLRRRRRLCGNNATSLLLNKTGALSKIAFEVSQGEAE
jgi:hypothetical protein